MGNVIYVEKTVGTFINRTVKLKHDGCGLPRCVEIGLGHLEETLQALGCQMDHTNSLSADIVIVYENDRARKHHHIEIDPAIGYEGFQIIHGDSGTESILYILSSSPKGAMYGILELAEQLINHNGHCRISPDICNPTCRFRAIKINLPWSGYREGASLEVHSETLKTLDFWRTFLDMMIKNRFNALTIWALHPFSYMIKSKTYPLATPYSDKEMAEWKKLWSGIFRMAKDRGIETYIINWNIFVSDSFKRHYDKKAVGELDGHYAPYTYHSDMVDDYLRECVVQLTEEYQDLTGLGVSLGERMVDMTAQSRQKWIEDVYFGAIAQAKREIKFNHRAAFSVSPQITRRSIENSKLPKPVLVEMKFNWSHAYSTTELLVTHGGNRGMSGYWDPKPRDYKMAWMVRNEDFFTLRRGQVDFVREHIKKNKHDYVAGYFIGSECFIPAYDYSYKKGSLHVNWRYGFQRHWLYYMLWGRLLYNPDIADDVFVKACTRRYGETVGERLFLAYRYACKMPMVLATFHNFDNEFSLYSEGFISTAYQKGYNQGEAFISIEDLIQCRPIDPQWLSVSDYAKLIVDNQPMPENCTTPPDLSRQLWENAESASTSSNVGRGMKGRMTMGSGNPDGHIYPHNGRKR